MERDIATSAARSAFRSPAALLAMRRVGTPAADRRHRRDQRLASRPSRFFTFQDPSLRYALIGSMLLGISCGLLGSFIVVRKMALVGDALSHAVLPGVALGFLWNMTKDPVAIFIGATVAGLLGTMVVSWITRTTRLKEDAALGLVLATFFAVGHLPAHDDPAAADRKQKRHRQIPLRPGRGASGRRCPADGDRRRAVSVVILVVFYKEFLRDQFRSRICARASACRCACFITCSCCCSPLRWWSRCRRWAWCWFRRC